MLKLEIGTQITHNGRRGHIQYYAVPGVRPGTYRKVSRKQAATSDMPFVAIWFREKHSSEPLEFVAANEVAR